MWEVFGVKGRALPGRAKLIRWRELHGHSTNKSRTTRGVVST